MSILRALRRGPLSARRIRFAGGDQRIDYEGDAGAGGRRGVDPADDESRRVAGEPSGYRNRAQFHIVGGGIGYLEAQSHRLCPITHCPISSLRVNEALAAIIGMMRDARWPRFVRSIEVFTNETDVQL